MAAGYASKLSVNEVRGRMVMRVAGGFNEGLRHDFLHNLACVKIDELDLSEVTGMDAAGIEMVKFAIDKHRIDVGEVSPDALAIMGSREFFLRGGNA